MAESTRSTATSDQLEDALTKLTIHQLYLTHTIQQLMQKIDALIHHLSQPAPPSHFPSSSAITASHGCLSLYFDHAKPQPPCKQHLDNGNLVMGKDCNIDQLNITIYGAEKGFCNVTLGDDCFLMGNIVLHQPRSTVRIGDRVFIGPNTTIFCYEEVEISNDVMFSWGCTIIDTNAHSLISRERMSDVMNWKKGWQFKNWSVVASKKITIKEKCWIGFNSIVMKGVTLEEGTVVGAGSVVTKSSDPYTIIGGNPAQFIKSTE